MSVQLAPAPILGPQLVALNSNGAATAWNATFVATVWPMFLMVTGRKGCEPTDWMPNSRILPSNERRAPAGAVVQMRRACLTGAEAMRTPIPPPSHSMLMQGEGLGEGMIEGSG